MKRKVTVLKGGISSEREVSLRTGAAVEKALRSLDYEVEVLDLTTTELELTQEAGTIFICLHGTFGEDGTLQAWLE
ncbi:MAG: D-alanine--D-alanine ligase, partial [Blastochloris sp.]|nr:D-alanine--D-alanine ligase [Blastochloris sp.]